MKTVDEIASELQGSCHSLNEVLERNNMEGADNDAEFCASLDSLVFCCECCNWWCEVSEMADDGGAQGICFDCVES